MTKPIQTIITGASGRMGQMLIRQVFETDGFELHAATDRDGAEVLGQDAGLLAGLGREIGIPVGSDLAAAVSGADAIIDFTIPDATCAHAEIAAEAKAALVIGTTGFADDHLERLGRAAQKTAIVRAGNMSLGVNLLVQLTRKVAAALDEDFDIEIIEAHHNRKIDAPSGTALMLGEAAADGRGVALSDAADRARDGITGARERGKIGFHAIRGGDVVGEHDVVFAADGERIVLRHLATDRRIFARGALKAASWAQGREHGSYDMLDVLGL